MPLLPVITVVATTSKVTMTTLAFSYSINHRRWFHRFQFSAFVSPISSIFFPTFLLLPPVIFILTPFFSSFSSFFPSPVSLCSPSFFITASSVYSPLFFCLSFSLSFFSIFVTHLLWMLLMIFYTLQLFLHSYVQEFEKLKIICCCSWLLIIVG